jgi:hypothetical protein
MTTDTTALEPIGLGRGLAEWQRLFQQQNWAEATEDQVNRALSAMARWLMDAALLHDEACLETALKVLRSSYEAAFRAGCVVLEGGLMALAEVARAGLDRAQQHNWARRVNRSSLEVQLLQYLAGSGGGVAIQPMASSLKTSEGLVSQMVSTFVARGYLVRDRHAPSEAYLLTPRGQAAVDYWAQHAAA